MQLFLSAFGVGFHSEDSEIYNWNEKFKHFAVYCSFNSNSLPFIKFMKSECIA